MREAESTIQVETVAVDRNTDHFTQRNMREYMMLVNGKVWNWWKSSLDGFITQIK